MCVRRLIASEAAGLVDAPCNGVVGARFEGILRANADSDANVPRCSFALFEFSFKAHRWAVIIFNFIANPGRVLNFTIYSTCNLTSSIQMCNLTFKIGVAFQNSPFHWVN